MHRIEICVCVLIIATVAVYLPAWGATQRVPVPAHVWEYETVEHPGLYPGDMKKLFNDLGARGWEYCGSEPAEHRVEGESIRPVMVSIFKRSKAKPSE